VEPSLVLQPSAHGFFTCILEGMRAIDNDREMNDTIEGKLTIKDLDPWIC
jgi:hypothetical protein